MKKNYMINLFTIIISILVSSLASVGAISTMYDGTEVSYDNSSTHIAATDVQGAIDQIYATATDYTNLNNRLQILENNFPAFTTTSTHTVEYPYSGNGINLGKFSPTNDIWFDLYANGKIQGSINPLVDGGVSIRGWKDGSSLQGTVELKGKKIDLSSNKIVAGNKNLYYYAGDTVTFYVKPAVMVQSATIMRFQVPLDKPVASGVTPNVSIISGTVFQSSGKWSLAPANYSISSQVFGTVVEVTVTSSQNYPFTVDRATTGDIQITLSFT